MISRSEYILYLLFKNASFHSSIPLSINGVVALNFFIKHLKLYINPYIASECFKLFSALMPEKPNIVNSKESRVDFPQEKFPAYLGTHPL